MQKNVSGIPAGKGLVIKKETPSSVRQPHTTRFSPTRKRDRLIVETVPSKKLCIVRKTRTEVDLRLTLTELGSLTSFLETRLLSFLHTCITC